MKLVRYGPAGREKPGIIDAGGKIRDLSRIVPDIDGATLASGGLAKIKKANLNRLKLVPGKPRLGACVGNVRNFIAIGLNYSDHAAEAGMPIPKEPIIFNKAPTSICGPNDDTVIPKESRQARLGGRARHRDRQARALSRPEQGDERGRRLFRCNDVSERAFQIERRRAMDQGQGLRDLRPARAVARHQGRDQGPAESRHVARRQRRDAPDRQHQDHDLRRRAHRLVLLAVLRDGAGRRHHHRHAARRRARHEARRRNS